MDFVAKKIFKQTPALESILLRQTSASSLTEAKRLVKNRTKINKAFFMLQHSSCIQSLEYEPRFFGGENELSKHTEDRRHAANAYSLENTFACVYTQRTFNVDRINRKKASEGGRIR